MSRDLKLSIRLEALDFLSRPIDRIQDRLNALHAPLRAIRGSLWMAGHVSGLGRVTEALGRVGSAAGRVAAIGGAAGLAGGFGFNRLFVRPAADMERLEITLDTVMGSAEAARRALGWVSDFAEETPYEVGEVSSAFVQMRTSGIDPMAGALRAAGDAAAIFHTNLSDAVGALLAARRGEFDPLERFGVTARTEGDRVLLEWERQGVMFRTAVNKNNRALLTSRIVRAWQDVAGGGMAKLSRSWDGMLSNLSDTWTRFSTNVMRAGVFDWMKLRLERLLGVTGRMRADGSMQTWAEATSSALIRAFGAMERFLLGYDRIADPGNQAATERVPGLFERLADMGRRADDAFKKLRDVLRPIIGDFDALDAALGALAVVTFQPLIIALTALGIALATTPAGAAIVAIGAIATAGLAIRNNWGGLGDWFGEQVEAIRRFGESSLGSLVDGPLNDLRAAGGALQRAWEGVGTFFRDLFDGMERRVRSLGEAVEGLLRIMPRGEGDTPRLQPNGGGRILRRMGGIGDGRQSFGGEVRVVVDDRRVTVTTRPDSPDVEMPVMARGLNMGVA